jgi:hypothetical protein
MKNPIINPIDTPSKAPVLALEGKAERKARLDKLLMLIEAELKIWERDLGGLRGEERQEHIKRMEALDAAGDAVQNMWEETLEEDELKEWYDGAVAYFAQNLCVPPPEEGGRVRRGAALGSAIKDKIAAVKARARPQGLPVPEPEPPDPYV